MGYCKGQVIKPSPMLREALLAGTHTSHELAVGVPWSQDAEPRISCLVMEEAKAVSLQYDPVWPFSMWLKTFQRLGARQQQPLPELGAL